MVKKGVGKIAGRKLKLFLGIFIFIAGLFLICAELGYSNIVEFFPSNNSNFNFNSVNFNLSSSANFTYCGLSINDGANVTMTLNDSLTGASYTNSSIADGNYNFTITCNDTDNNFNTTQLNWFLIDTIVPQINFTGQTPADGTNQTATAISVNVSSNDTIATNQHSTFLDWNNSLVLWMRMDDRKNSTYIYDNSSWGNNGTIYGGANYTDAGKFGGAMTFDGVDDYIDAGNSTNSKFGHVNDTFTFGAWVLTNNSDVGQHTIVGLAGTELSRQFYIFTNGGFATLKVHNGTDTPAAFSGVFVADNKWHHVVGTKNLTSISIFVDGILKSSAPYNITNDIENSGYIGIGHYGTPGIDYYFNGSIDDVMIFNRELSNSEISALYNSTANQYYNNFTNLSDGDYKFKAYSQDLAGNVNSTEEKQIFVDANAPVVNLISPSDSYSSTSTATIFSYNVSDSSTTNCSLILNNNFVNFNSSVNIAGSINSFANLTAIGSYTWNINCTDVYNHVGNSSVRSFTINSGGGGSTGGGGGGSSKITTKPTFEIIPSYYQKSIALGKIESDKIKIVNNASYEKTFEIKVEDVSEIISLEKSSLKIPAGGSSDLNFRIISPASIGVYTGKIIVTSGGSSVEVLVNVNAKTEESLFDISLTISDEWKSFFSGKNIRAQIKLLQMGLKEKMDVTMNYLIKDFNGQTILTESETFSITDEKSYVKELDTSKLSPGDYVLGTELVYPDGVAVASQQFKIEKKETTIGSKIFSILILALLVAFVAVGFIIRRNSEMESLLEESLERYDAYMKKYSDEPKDKQQLALRIKKLMEGK